MYRNGNRLNLRSVYWIYNVSLGNIRHQHKNLCQQSPKPDNSKPETMSNIPRTTSESEQSTHEENEAMSILAPPQVRTRARRGPIIPVAAEDLNNCRNFWQNCLIAIIIDIRRFSVETVQQSINRAWRIRDRVTVVGGEGNHFVLHFNNNQDQRFILEHGAWSLDSALMAMDVWRPNTPLNSVNIYYIQVWVQLWGLPLEYQQPSIAQRIAQTIGTVSEVDWTEIFPRNISFLRVRVWIDPNTPLMAGSMLRRDDGVMTWVEFRYERIHTVCLRCGSIGHTAPHCPQLNPDIERMINDQMESNNRRFDYETGYDLQNILFTNNIRAIHNRQNRRTTRIEVNDAEDNTDYYINDNRIPDEPIPSPIPLDVVFPDEADHGLQQRHDHPEDHPEEFFQQSNREINSLVNPEIQPVYQPVYQDPFIQPENNTPRWIQLPGGEVMFTNGRLDESNSRDQPESSAMGELRAPMEMQENLSAEDLPLCIELCLQQEADNTNDR